MLVVGYEGWALKSVFGVFVFLGGRCFLGLCIVGDTGMVWYSIAWGGFNPSNLFLSIILRHNEMHATLQYSTLHYNTSHHPPTHKPTPP